MFDNQTGSVVGFRGVASANVFMTVALDAPNKVALFTIDVNALAAAMPAATTAQAGVLETATDAEAIAKTATDKIVTPSNFAAMASSQTFQGLVELATDAETITGTSTTLAVTPAGLAAVLVSSSGTETWADAPARLGATPDFAGQFGVQLDLDLAFISTGVAAGDFDVPIMMLSGDNTVSGATAVDIGIHSLTIFGGSLQLGNGQVIFNDATITLGGPSGSTIDFNTATSAVGLFVNGVLMANSVFTTGISGEPVGVLITTFLSNTNTQIYGLPTGAMARTTFATYAGQAISNPPTQAEVQALDNAVVIVSQRLAALITDLRATLKPHAT